MVGAVFGRFFKSFRRLRSYLIGGGWNRGRKSSILLLYLELSAVSMGRIILIRKLILEKEFLSLFKSRLYSFIIVLRKFAAPLNIIIITLWLLIVIILNSLV